MINQVYSAAEDRYENGMKYRRCGKSGILLPEISLGLWHNFGDTAPLARSRDMLLHAFDKGICHFDLANNYGPSYGSAESTFGQIMSSDLRPYRDELFISTKPGWDMWPGPYGDHGSRKYLFSSLDQSLKRMKLDYVDIFYSHRFDPDTPVEETLQALVDIVRSGKALYVGISQYPREVTHYAYQYLAERDVPYTRAGTTSSTGSTKPREYWPTQKRTVQASFHFLLLLKACLQTDTSTAYLLIQGQQETHPSLAQGLLLNSWRRSTS